MEADGWDSSLLYAVHQTLSLSFSIPARCTVTASGAAGHNRGSVAEPPLLTRTQGRTVLLTSLRHVLSQGGFLVCLLMRLAPGTRTEVVGRAHEGLLPQPAE